MVTQASGRGCVWLCPGLRGGDSSWESGAGLPRTPSLPAGSQVMLSGRQISHFPVEIWGEKKIFLVCLNPSRRCGELEPRCGDNHFVLSFSKAFLQNQLDLLFLSSFILKLTRWFPCSGVPKQRFGGCGTPQTPFDVAAIAPSGAGARQWGRSGCGNIDPLGRGSQLSCEGAL